MFSRETALHDLAKVCYDTNASKDELFENGVKIVRRMYGATSNKNILNDLRFVKYKAAAKTNSVKIEALPPTEAAARQHCYRVYHQIQI